LLLGHLAKQFLLFFFCLFLGSSWNVHLKRKKIKILVFLLDGSLVGEAVISGGFGSSILWVLLNQFLFLCFFGCNLLMGNLAA